ncbi:NACHT domain-containing protein [Streptomyces sp. bgisy130]|uniref:NACHT domain-containing protein n=1 Tax=Streptomyces sp. bgisy130 TaxID=3413788 RepID=UPI003F49E0EC
MGERQRGLVAACLVGVVAVVLGVAWAWGGVAYAGNLASVLGACSLLAGLWKWADRARQGHSTTGQADEAAGTLARLVEQQWAREAALRRLDDPVPLPVRWRDCPRLGADHQRLTGGPFSCRTDDPQGLAAAFRALPRRRMVVLGSAGSGKTMLAVQLTLALARTRGLHEPVPVLLPLSSFEPERMSLSQWVRQQLAADYPALCDAAVHGPSAIEDLVASQRILPILDGLDELPEPGRALALAAVNDVLAGGGPLVLTCRTAAYVQAVAASDVLTAAVVIEPDPVPAQDAVTYLRMSTPPGLGQDRWGRLAERLRQQPDCPAATALASPLMVALTRSVYATGAADPAELTDPERFADTQSIERHLLGALVPVLVSRAARQDPMVSSSRPVHRWKPEQAQRWLTCIAQQLHRQNTYELAWWRLYQALPSLANTWPRACLVAAGAAVLALVGEAAATLAVAGQWAPGESFDLAGRAGVAMTTALTAALMSLVLVVLADALVRRARPALSAVCLGVIVGFVAGVLVGLDALIYGVPAAQVLPYVYNDMPLPAFAYSVVLFCVGLPYPPKAPQRATLRGGGRRLLRSLAIAPLLAIAFSLLIGGLISIYSLLNPEDTRMGVFYRPAYVQGLVLGIVPGLGLAVLRWARAPLADDDSATPATTLRADRHLSLLLGGYAAITFVIFFVGASHSPYQVGETVEDILSALWGWAETMAYVPALSGVLLGLLATSWLYYTVARAWLALRGRLPFRLQAFLHDAHRLGILRQAGPAYQFRHALLQDHLATCNAPPTPGSAKA